MLFPWEAKELETNTFGRSRKILHAGKSGRDTGLDCLLKRYGMANYSFANKTHIFHTSSELAS